MKQGRFIILSGPSGVGKGTICSKLLEKMDLWYSVSTTTRSPREGEVDGVNYYFTTKEEFERQINENEFLEYNVYNDNYYGTLKKHVVEKIENGIDVISEVDVNGAKNIKKIFPNTLLIFIAPPSMEVLKERLLGRGTESADKVAARLKIAQVEMKEKSFFDYVVINDDLEKAISDVENIILSERKKDN